MRRKSRADHGLNERPLCKCAGDFYELRESGNALIGTQEGIERSMLVVLPQEVSESFVAFAID